MRATQRQSKNYFAVTLAGLIFGISITALYQRIHHGGSDAVVAEWRGGSIRASEVYGPIKGQLSSLIDELYRTKRKAIDDYIEKNLLEEEAKRVNIPVGALIAKESTVAPEKISDQEMEKFLAERGLSLKDPRIKRNDVQSYMQYVKATEHRESYVAKLREKSGTRILLALPDEPKIKVDLDSYPKWGNDRARVTVVEFADFESPESARVASELSRLRKEYGPEKIKLVFRDMIGVSHPHSLDAANAAHCAGEQGKFWEYHDALFENTKRLTAADLKRYAGAVSLDPARFEKCFATRKYQSMIDESRTEAEGVGIRMIPSYLVNGSILEGAVSYDRLKAHIDQELGQESGPVKLTDVN